MDAEENRRLTQVGPGTPGGDLLRQYWQPAALTEELDGDRDVVAVRLMGEDLVLYRDEATSGDETPTYGLLDRACAHRRVDLSFGRQEDGGLRCPYHGWLFDHTGACLETPAEPAGSTFCDRVRQPAYPFIERNGIIWAWMGEGEPPPLPGLDAFSAPNTHVFAFKGMWDCNWLQAHEVGIDPAHSSFLHRFLGPVEEEYGLQFRAMIGDTGVPTTVLMREVVNPDISVEPTDFGFRLRTLRNYRDEFTHVRITNCIFPNAITIPMSSEIAITQWHVPIDDHSCYWYSMFVSFGDPVDGAQMREQRVGAVELPLYKPLTGAHNNWGHDPDEQRTLTYTGMGDDINVHDQWAVESPGAIHDRTREHLSPADVGLRLQRRMMLAAFDSPSPTTLVGTADPTSLVGPPAIDAVAKPGANGNLDACWREQERARRAAATWTSDAVVTKPVEAEAGATAS